MLNSVNLMGRLVRDPELKYTNSGLAVLNFTLACDNGRKGEDKTAYFIDCVAWRKTAELVSEWCAKGRLLVVSGQLTTSSYKDQDGKNRKKCEVLVNSISFCDYKDKDSGGSSGGAARHGGCQQQPESQEYFGDQIEFSEEDIPF